MELIATAGRKGFLKTWSMGASQNYGYLFGDPHNKGYSGYSVLGSI